MCGVQKHVSKDKVSIDGMGVSRAVQETVEVPVLVRKRAFFGDATNLSSTNGIIVARMGIRVVDEVKKKASTIKHMAATKLADAISN